MRRRRRARSTRTVGWPGVSRTRRRVAEALISLLEEGNPQPTAKEIANRAGVSLRLVFHHFDDMDALYHAVAKVNVERHWKSLYPVPADLPFEHRVERTVRQRYRLFEAISPVRRAAIRQAYRSKEIGATLAESTKALREQVAATFAPELNAAGAARRGHPRRPRPGDVLGGLGTAADGRGADPHRGPTGARAHHHHPARRRDGGDRWAAAPGHRRQVLSGRRGDPAHPRRAVQRPRGLRLRAPLRRGPRRARRGRRPCGSTTSTRVRPTPPRRCCSCTASPAGATSTGTWSRPWSAAGHRVVVPDLVGFGRSDKPAARSDYTYARPRRVDAPGPVRRARPPAT